MILLAQQRRLARALWRRLTKRFRFFLRKVGWRIDRFPWLHVVMSISLPFLPHLHPHLAINIGRLKDGWKVRLMDSPIWHVL